MPEGPRKGVPPWVWLVSIGVVSALVHFVALEEQARFPLLATDEVQYVTVADSLRLGRGFTTRGEFHAGLPPLYPLLIAVAHSWGSDPRLSALALSCLVVALAVFPAYGLARHTGISIGTSCLLAAAAAFLPHTVYSGLYMTETLSYPLFLASFWALARWVEQPSIHRDLLAGVLLSALLLTKVAAWSFVAAVLASVIVVSCAPSSEGRPRARLGLHAALVFGLVAAAQSGWLAYKHAHGTSALGMYGHVLEDQGLPHLSASLLSVYLADFLLAPGLLATVPLLLWFSEAFRRRFALSVLLATTLLFQVTIHGVLEAGLTGLLKERLFLYALAIVPIFAVRGMAALSASGRLARVLFVVVPLVLLPILALYPFDYNPVVDVPWASALGSAIGWPERSFTRPHLFGLAAFTILAGGIPILWFSTRRIQMALALFFLGFNALAFANSARGMYAMSLAARVPVTRVTNWLHSSQVHSGDRLVICGNMAYYEERHRWTPIDDFFLEWHRRFDLSDLAILQIETVGRFDVRIARNPDQIAELMRPGDRLLAATRMTGLDLVSYQYPYYLYTLRRPSTQPPRPLYIVDISQELAYGWPLGYPPEQQPYLMLGQPVNLPPGRYRARLLVVAGPVGRIKIEVVGQDRDLVAFSLKGKADAIRDFEFCAPGDTPLQFRLSGRGILGASYHDTIVELIHPDGMPAPDPAAP